jgi:hypothetical protein
MILFHAIEHDDVNSGPLLGEQYIYTKTEVQSYTRKT